MDTNKERVLSAATELLDEQGLGGLSVRSIAKRAGLSTIAIYSHFKGKQGVLDALYIEGFEALDRAMLAANEHPEPLTAALRGCESYLELARKNEARYRLTFGETDISYEPSTEARQVARKAFESLVKLTARQFPKDTPYMVHQRAALETWALIHGFVSLRHHVMRELMDYEDWKTMVLGTVIHNMRKKAASNLKAEDDNAD